MSLTRRSLLEGIGVAAIAATSLGKAATAFAAGPASIARSGRGGALLLQGAEILLLDPAVFGGSPRVTVSADAGATTLELSGARYPGTALSADGTWALDDEGYLDISLALGGFAARVPAVAWLSGRRVAESRVSFSHLSALDSTGCRVELHGSGTAQFSPDGLLRVLGVGIAAARLGASTFVADEIALSLLSADDPTVLSVAVARRCSLELHRGTETWDFSGIALSEAAGKLACAQDAADSLAFECAESGAGAARHAVVIDFGDEAVSYTPAGDSPLGSDVCLLGARAVIASTCGRQSCALVAEPKLDGRLQVAGLGADVVAGSASLTAVGTSALEEVSFAPQLSALHVPMPDSVAQPLTFPSESNVVLPLGNAAVASVNRLSAGVASAAVILPDGTSLAVLRPDDFVSLTFRFWGWFMETDGATTTLRPNGTSARIEVNFPPQSFNEHIVPPKVFPPLPVQISGGSRLGFTVGASAIPNGIDYSVAGLLDWSAFSQNVMPYASYGPFFSDGLADPRGRDAMTYLEMPWRLFISPHEYAKWTHHRQPFTSAGWTSLWHTSLGTKPGATGQIPQTVRAIWATDYQAGPQPWDEPQSYPLTQVHRATLVNQSGRDRLAAVDAPLLMLSSMGGWMNLSGAWPDTQPINGWKHRAAMGRDNFVRITRPGFLFPFGHRCVLVEQTERRFDKPRNMITGVSGPTQAYLYFTQYLIIKEPVKSYSNVMRPDWDRGFPFRKIRIVPSRTPALDPLTPLISDVGTTGAIIPKVGEKQYLFDVVAEDWVTGHEVSFAAPLVWVGSAVEDNAWLMGQAASAYSALGVAADLAGQKVALAGEGGMVDSTSLQVAKMTFGAQLYDAAGWPGYAVFAPRFYPSMVSADVRSAELSALAKGDVATKISYYQPYLANTWWQPGEVYAQIDTPLPVTTPSESSGGIATYAVGLTGFSRKYGPVAGPLDVFNSGQFDPARYFASPAATTGASVAGTSPELPVGMLLGALPLAKILNAATGNRPPTISVTRSDTEEVVTFKFDSTWMMPTAATDPLCFRATTNTRMSLLNEVHRPLAGGSGSNIVRGSIDNFSLVFPPGAASDDAGVELRFTSLDFSSGTSAGTSVTPVIEGVHFLGPLKYFAKVAELFSTYMAFMSMSSLSAASTASQGARPAGAQVAAYSPIPGVSVSSTGIEIAQSVPIPDFAVGIAALVNMDLGAKLSLPFSGAFGFEMNLSTPDDPFGVSVCLLTGSGSFRIRVTTEGIDAVEISLAVGAMIAMNFGVASGAISVSYNIGFLKTADSGMVLKASERYSGAVSVLGLVRVSICCEFGLEYRGKPEGGDLVGFGTVTVKIKLAFFSKTVRFDIRHEIAGSDPPFDKMIGPEEWQAYCAAFAPVPTGV